MRESPMFPDAWSSAPDQGSAPEVHCDTPGRPPLTPEEVFHAFAPRVYNVARRMLGNEADAEDVTQEVLLQVVRKLDTFRGEAEITTWLHKVTVQAVRVWRAGP